VKSNLRNNTIKDNESAASASNVMKKNLNVRETCLMLQRTVS